MFVAGFHNIVTVNLLKEDNNIKYGYGIIYNAVDKNSTFKNCGNIGPNLGYSVLKSCPLSTLI